MYFHLILALAPISTVYGACSDLAIEDDALVPISTVCGACSDLENDALVLCERMSKAYDKSKAQLEIEIEPDDSESGPRGEGGCAQDITADVCRTIGCICRDFGNTPDPNSNECILPDGQKLTRAVRKEYRTLTDEERQRFHNAMWEIKRNGELDKLAKLYKQHAVASGAHEGPGFLPWHREFLKRVEFALRRADYRVSLPFWDSTMDNLLPDPRDSIIWTNDFMGNLSDEVKFGSFAGWTTIENKTLTRSVGKHGETMSSADRDEFLASNDIDRVFGLTAAHMNKSCTSYRVSTKEMEYLSGYVRHFVGGDMEFAKTAANDPMFYLVHSFVDQTWELWRQAKQNRIQRETQYPASRPECFLPYHNYFSGMGRFGCTLLRGIYEGLENFYTDNFYEYQPSPNCPYCDGSPYLFCHPRANKCASKIRPGGNCTGLENADACYDSICSNGKCVKSSAVNKEHLKAMLIYRLSNKQDLFGRCQDMLNGMIQSVARNNLTDLSAKIPLINKTCLYPENIMPVFDDFKQLLSN
ncbi:CBN-TYR-3 protein [Aphelenchoides bicaudatus]|nr:CBN-TYR-3 protein [Aphelenchoides bicaudatus]